MFSFNKKSTEDHEQKDKGILSFLTTLLAAFVLVQIINLTLFQSYRVFGSSMVPTLHEGDRLIISKASKTLSEIKGSSYIPSRGDVIVFEDPLDPKIQLIKRVIGLPGERVVVKNGDVTVYNDQRPDGFMPDQELPYGPLAKSSSNQDIVVPDGELFVSGDNRFGNNSLDSRNELGTVPLKNIAGKLVLRIWPFNDAKFF